MKYSIFLIFALNTMSVCAMEVVALAGGSAVVVFGTIACCCKRGTPRTEEVSLGVQDDESQKTKQKEQDLLYIKIITRDIPLQEELEKYNLGHVLETTSFWLTRVEWEDPVTRRKHKWIRSRHNLYASHEKPLEMASKMFRDVLKKIRSIDINCYDLGEEEKREEQRMLRNYGQRAEAGLLYLAEIKHDISLVKPATRELGIPSSLFSIFLPSKDKKD